MAEKIQITFEWDGEAMVPLQRFHNVANAEFTVGERYRMEAQEYHSWVSHQHQFAWLHEAWLSLPRRIADRFLNEDQLRKHALIDGGFCDCTTVSCATRAEAERWFQVLTKDDPYCIVRIEGASLMRFTAQSQSMKAMGPKRFQQSKQHVLDFVSNLLEADSASTERAAA
jgi:hypothetical protein